jgi:hypothetical protein
MEKPDCQSVEKKYWELIDDASKKYELEPEGLSILID